MNEKSTQIEQFGAPAILIVSQGGLAGELLSAARTIAARPLPRFGALCLDWDESSDSAQRRVEEAIAGLDQTEGLLILTDIFGATPYNIAVQFRRPGRVAVLTGVNLPMVLRLACSSEPLRPLEELVEWLKKKAQRSICIAEGSGRQAAPGVIATPTRGAEES